MKYTISILFLLLFVSLTGCGENATVPTTLTTESLEDIENGDRWMPSVDVFLRDGIAGSNEGGVKDYSIIEADGVYHVFYIHNPRRGWRVWPDPGEDRFGHATSNDLRTWTLHTPIYLSEGTYSATCIWAPHVFEENDTYFMFYTGVNWGPLVNPDHPESDYKVERILLATSTDLYTWELHGETGLVLDGPAGVDWSCWGDDDDVAWTDDCRDPFVYKDDDQYVMFVSIRQEEQNGCRKMVLATALSTDLFNWSWNGILPETEQGTGHDWPGAESANVIKYGNWYYLMWSDAGLRLAYSTDILGPYTEMDASCLYGYANEFIRETSRIVYGAIVNDYELQFKKISFSGGTPAVYIHDFTEDDFPSAPPFEISNSPFGG